MNEIFLSNLHLISASTMWFIKFFGINTPEFTEALTGSTIGAVGVYYKNKGIEFDIEKTEIEDAAMLYAYDRIMGIAKLASLAASLGITPKDIED